MDAALRLAPVADVIALADLAPAAPRRRLRLALVLDPRFPGGTGSAVAAEIRVLAPRVDLTVVGLTTAMFRDREINPALQRALDDHGLSITWNPEVVHAETIVFHNPACLKFDTALGPRLSAGRTLVVTHENFLRPSGQEGFDVSGCLARIDARLVTGRRLLAPVSPHNRRTVATWLSTRQGEGWDLAPADWFNVCDQPLAAPSAAPRDRRGRHSRSGLEKFPSLATMLAHFPPHAERCAILGGDGFLADSDGLPRHWQVLRFGAADVAGFLAGIDFFIYFTHPLWQESFGRVIAEAIAAGKLVITDPATAEPFPGVVTDPGSNVDRLVRGFVADPAAYTAQVRAAQAGLERYRPAAFLARALALAGSETAAVPAAASALP